MSNVNDYKDTISVFIQNRDGILAEEEVKAVTSENAKGVFDILPHHANFISLIKNHIILYLITGQQKEIKISEGILEVNQNHINIFLDSFSKAF